MENFPEDKDEENILNKDDEIASDKDSNQLLSTNRYASLAQTTFTPTQYSILEQQTLPAISGEQLSTNKFQVKASKENILLKQTSLIAETLVNLYIKIDEINLKRAASTHTILGPQERTLVKKPIKWSQEIESQILEILNRANIEIVQNSLDTNPSADQVPEEENIMGLLQKAGETLFVPSENSSRNKGTLKQAEQNIITNSWKPADMFSTLGERERDKHLLDAKKSQWKKELDEQVALKKKLKENLESKCHLWQKADAVKNCSEKGQMAEQVQMPFSEDLSAATEDSHICGSSTTEASDPSPSISSGQTGQFSSFSSPDLPAAIRSSFVLGEATPVEHAFSAVKREQKKKWLEELDKQKEAAKLRKKEEKCDLSKVEEHDQWTMHFDSFRNNAYSSSQCPLNTTYKKPTETLHFSPEPQDSITFTPTEVESSGKSVGSHISEASQKGSFLRSMTALLDPAQIEERERRRQKQIEHQVDSLTSNQPY
ncbi:UNVERIFIED_CONTAM: hypothetical protein K2H54_049651 [Gekko kuhli]